MENELTKSSKIFVTGHRGMLGSAVIRRLLADGYTKIITRTHSELDLTSQYKVNDFFAQEKPEFVFHIAARTGGIADNKAHPADSLYLNAMMTMNVIKAAFDHTAKKLIYVGSVCVYPENAPQPMTEDMLQNGKPEFFWGGYALAKTLGIRLCEYYNRQHGVSFFAVNPPNLYGQNDKGSTVLPMLIDKFYQAVKKNADAVEIWGTGNARREFLHADDLADAMLFLAENYNGGEHFNVGWEVDVSIRELAELINEISGFNGKLIFDPTKPEGAARKLLNSSKLHKMGWKPKIMLKEGIETVYREYGR